MTKPAWENLGVFFQSDRKGGFAKAAFFYSADGTPLTDTEGKPIEFFVIYDESKLDAMAGEFEYDTEEPRILLPEHPALNGLRRDDYVEIQDQGTFDLAERPRADGTGTLSIQLNPR